MKKIPLLPYPGFVWYCDSRKEFLDAYEELCLQQCPFAPKSEGGQYVKIAFDQPRETIWLLWATGEVALAHELNHVLLQTFKIIGHDPTEGDGEPYCYMHSHLMEEAGAPE